VTEDLALSASWTQISRKKRRTGRLWLIMMPLLYNTYEWSSAGNDPHQYGFYDGHVGTVSRCVSPRPS